MDFINLLYHWVDLQKQRISHIKTAPIQLLPEIFENANNLLIQSSLIISITSISPNDPYKPHFFEAPSGAYNERGMYLV